MSQPTPPTTVSSVQALAAAELNKKLTTRIQRLHLFQAPMSAPLPAAITATATVGGTTTVELLQLNPAHGWVDMGLIGSDDAPSWEREMDTQDLLAIGFRDAVRTDVTSDVSNLTCTFLERKRAVLETYDNIDMSGIVPNASTGEIKWTRPQDAPLIERRYLAYGQDGTGADRVWMVKALPAGVVSNVDSQAWGGESFTTFPVTLKGNVDTELGTSMINYMGGPGVKAQLADMGFAA